MRSTSMAGQVKKGLLWSFALLFAAIATVIAVVPTTLPALHLVFWLLVGSLVANHNPPSIASGIASRNNKIDPVELNKNGQAFQTLLQLTFPIGTKVEKLERELRRQGFRPMPPPPRNCLPAGQSAPTRTLYTHCYDPKDILVYSWSNGLVCGETITVRWVKNDRSEITQLTAGWNVACL